MRVLQRYARIAVHSQSSVPIESILLGTFVGEVMDNDGRHAQYIGNLFVLITINFGVYMKQQKK